MRLERQTRSEDVCVLVHSDGQFHLERIAPGVFQSRIYEGTFPADQVAELRQMLDNDKLKGATQQQIKMELVGEDQDQVLLAIDRANGWQSLHFPSGNSRKPYKEALDPLLKWLDRAKQQPHAMPNAVSDRCMPAKDANAETQTASAGSGSKASAEIKSSEKNPYLMRFVEDHMSTSQEHAASIVRGMQEDSVDATVEQTCMIVYASGKYRLEKTKQIMNDKPRSQVYLSTLTDSQLGELKQLLSDPQVANLQHTTDAVAGGIREGEIVNLAIPRGPHTQMLSFASRFGVRTQAAGMKDNLTTQVDEELNNIKPLRKWLKSNLEDRKGAPAKDEAATNCMPEQ
jgi:hypothetical protein